MLATPVTATLRTSPGADADRPALPATAGPTWAELLADVPNNTALWAAVQFGATLAPRGSCGEYPYTWTYVRGADTWHREDGHGNLVEVDETAVGVGIDGVRDDVEILEWTRDWQADRLSTAYDVRLDAEYSALAELAESLGTDELAAFRAAMEALYAADPYALDGELYARLTGRDGEPDVEPEGDEDIGSGR